MILPEIDISPEKLYRMCFAAVQSKLLIAGIRLKVFNRLSEPKTAQQAAASIGSHTENTMLLLNGLAACGLLSKKNGLYLNTPIAGAFLVEGSDSYLGEGFIQQADMADMKLDDLIKMVMEGPACCASEEKAHSEKKCAEQAVWMANHERCGIAQQMASIVSGLPEFESFGKMLDLGGGPGMFGIAMVSQHPNMKGVVFDRKEVVKVADNFILNYGLEKRMETLAGDYNKDPIGEGYDLIWSSSTLNFAQQNMDKVMERIYNALNPGGLFINLSEGLTQEGTQPDFFVFCTLKWAMSNPFKSFAQGEIADAMIKAGYKSVRSRTLHTGWGIMDLDIARK